MIIVLNNRHKNLDRLLEYYQATGFFITIADSSVNEHIFKKPLKENWQYVYTPGETYIQKIERTLKSISTPFVVICADDDFIIPSALEKCVLFLQNNPSYAAVQGNVLAYYKESIHKKHVEFNTIYTKTEYDLQIADPLRRLETFFEDYRSVAYAVHRTAYLDEAFKTAGNKIYNLYLYEYLTAVVPVTKGFYKELNILFQVREYATDSDDKTADNLDKIFNDEKYKPELDSFISFLSFKLNHILPDKDQLFFYAFLQDIFKKLAVVIHQSKFPSISSRKKIGRVIQHIPFLGNWIIRKNRAIEKNRRLSKVVKTPSERNDLAKIESILKKHA
ncbi:TIGR00180 family glycosyltransferase [Parafilimonas sp.]|uniref:TIGR00180 family glycosyltransferase n=1 Tax=Parafilimonas sp. TaxID=1969739 RepID=UPI0039E64DDC